MASFYGIITINKGGCDFTQASNWNGTLTNNSQVYITSNQSITLFISISLSLSSLSFGVSGSSVNIVLSASSLSLTLSNSPNSGKLLLFNLKKIKLGLIIINAGSKNVMLWGNTSSLVLNGSSISSYSIQGGFLSLYNNSMSFK